MFFNFIGCIFFSKKKHATYDNYSIDIIVEGLRYYRGNDIGDWLQINDEVTLKPEPDNPHDNNAVIILWKGNKIGYLRKEITKDIYSFLIDDELTAHISKLSNLRFGRKWAVIRLKTKESIIPEKKELFQKVLEKHKNNDKKSNK